MIDWNSSGAKMARMLSFFRTQWLAIVLLRARFPGTLALVSVNSSWLELLMQFTAWRLPALRLLLAAAA
jgi:hypothetical protein